VCLDISNRLTNFGKNKDMNKFTDNFFGFPIKVYDDFSAKKAMDAEDKDTTNEPVPIDWIVGWAKIPVSDLHKLMWHDGFSRDRKVEQVASEGFDLTMVCSNTLGDFVCTWPKKKFEEKINEFMEKRRESQAPPPGTPYFTLTSTSPIIPDSPQGHGKKDE
jgi:hypothetical protein